MEVLGDKTKSYAFWCGTPEDNGRQLTQLITHVQTGKSWYPLICRRDFMVWLHGYAVEER